MFTDHGLRLSTSSCSSWESLLYDMYSFERKKGSNPIYSLQLRPLSSAGLWVSREVIKIIPNNFSQGPLSGSTLGAAHAAVVKANRPVSESSQSNPVMRENRWKYDRWGKVGTADNDVSVFDIRSSSRSVPPAQPYIRWCKLYLAHK